MKINEVWEVTGSRGDFVVIESRPGKNPKTGKPTVTTTRTFHPTLEQCAKKIEKVSGISALQNSGLSEVLSELNGIRESIEELLNAEAQAV